MKEDIMQKLSAVINALNNVSVCGKVNLGNMAGSINVLEEIAATLSTVELTEVEELKGNV